jgi:hypothetical protein
MKHFLDSLSRKVGRVTPCAPFGIQSSACGAHGVTRPTPIRSVFLKFCAWVFVLCAPRAAFACAACYGQSDSPLAQGMNWGIMTLLGVIFSVMSGIVVFFVHVGRKSGSLQNGEAGENQTDKKQ